MSEGAKIFERITSANVDQFLAIMLDGELYSAPRINEPITGGRCQISRAGGFPADEAYRLASVLENPLQAPVPRDGNAQRGSDVGQGLHRQRHSRGVDRRGRGDHFHGGVLFGGGHGRQHGAAHEHPDHGRRAGDVQVHADVARHRRRGVDHRNGGGHQCADLRARPGGTGGEQGVARRHRGGVLAGVSRHFRCALHGDPYRPSFWFQWAAARSRGSASR